MPDITTTVQTTLNQFANEADLWGKAAQSEGDYDALHSLERLTEASAAILSAVSSAPPTGRYADFSPHDPVTAPTFAIATVPTSPGDVTDRREDGDVYKSLKPSEGHISHNPFQTPNRTIQVSPATTSGVDWSSLGPVPTVTVPPLLDAPTVIPPDDVTPGSYVIPSFGGLTIPSLTVTLPTLDDLPVLSPVWLGDLDDPELPNTVLELPTLADPVLPDAPRVVSFEPVSFPAISIEIPTIPALTLPTMDISIPDANLPSTPEEFRFHEDVYSPEILDEVMAEVRAVMGGRNAIAAAIWNDLWSRGVGNLKRQEAAAIYEARSEHASLGWDMPGMPLFAREAAARQAANAAINDLTRENVVQQATQYREDFWQAVERGLACETILQNAHHQYQERRIRAAVESVNTGVAILQVASQAYHMLLQAKQLASQIILSKMQLALAPLEVFKAKLTAAQTAAQVAETKSKDAVNQLENEKTKIEHARVGIQNKELELRIALAALEVYKAKLDGIDKLIASKELTLKRAQAELEVYKTQLSGDDLRLKQREQNISLLKLDLEHYAQGLDKAKTEIQAKDLRLRGALASLEGYKASLLEVDANAKIDELRIKQYTEQWKGELTKVQAYQAWADATKSYVEAQKANVDAFASSVVAKQEQVKAWVMEWDAYTKSYEPARIAIAAQDAENGLFAQELGRYQALLTDAKNMSDNALANAEMKVKWVQADVARYAAESDAFAKQIGAAAQVYATDIQRWSEWNKKEDVRIDALTKQRLADIEVIKAKLGATIENARNTNTVYQAEAGMAAQIKGNIIGAYSQLGSAAYAAANITMGTSSSYGHTYGQSETKEHRYGVSVGVSVDSVSGGLDLDPPI